jgi:hypothetical protein
VIVELGHFALVMALAACGDDEAQNRDYGAPPDPSSFNPGTGGNDPYYPPTTTTIEVAPGEQRGGDVQGFKYVGKTMSREEFCIENGMEQPYAHQSQTPEHTVRK